MNLKMLIFIFLFGINIFPNFAQMSIKVTIDGINDPNLKTKIEGNASNFLTNINRALENNRKPSTKNDILTNDAAVSLLLMWEMSPFKPVVFEIKELLAQKPLGGYELRNIPVFVPNASKENQYQEIAIIFNNSGMIDNIYFTLESTRFNEILAFGIDVTEFRRRQIILDFIENFRTAYNRKDATYLESVFSEDALIITGKVLKVANNDVKNQMLSQEIISYQKQTKTEYLSRLKTVFNSNNYINIKFDEIEIQRHKLYPSIYGVQLFQEWNTTRYSDAGFIMLVIDFSNEDNPQIHVRTWQPEKLNGKRLTDAEKFNLDQFNIKK